MDIAGLRRGGSFVRSWLPNRPPLVWTSPPDQGHWATYTPPATCCADVTPKMAKQAVEQIKAAIKVEFHHGQENTVREQQSAARERRPGAARHDFDVFLVTIGENPAHLRNVVSQHHDDGQGAVGGECVAFVRPPAGLLFDDAFAGNNAPQRRDNFARRARTLASTSIAFISFHFVRKGPARRSLVHKTPASGWDRPSNGLELPVRVLQSEIANRVTSPPANHCERKPAARRVTPASLRWNARSAQISPKVLPCCASITARRSSSASRR
jgi:hypothetical protein